MARKTSKRSTKSKLQPGTKEHERAVKKLLKTQTATLEALEKLNVIESKDLEIGNAFLAFRFEIGT